MCCLIKPVVRNVGKEDLIQRKDAVVDLPAAAFQGQIPDVPVQGKAQGTLCLGVGLGGEQDGVILPAEVLYDLFLRRAQPRLIQLLRDAVAVRLRLCAVGDCRTAQHCLVFLLLCLPGEMGRRRHSLPQL